MLLVNSDWRLGDFGRRMSRFEQRYNTLFVTSRDGNISGEPLARFSSYFLKRLSAGFACNSVDRRGRTHAHSVTHTIQRARFGGETRRSLETRPRISEN